MTDRVVGQLADAGQLLREWRDTHVAPEGNDVRLVLSPVASASAPRPGRLGGGPWTRAGAVAAAVILVVGVVAILTIASGKDTLPVATPGAAVALVPSEDLLEQYDILSIDQNGPIDPPRDLVYYVPVASGDAAARVLVVREHLSVHQSPGPGMPVDVEGVTAHHLVVDDDAGPQYRTQHLLLPLDADGYERLRIAADPDRPLDLLVDLAVSIDPTRRLADQDLPGWQLLASYDESLGRADFRFFMLGDDGSELSGSSWAGAGPGAEWFATGTHAHDDRRAIGGRELLVTQQERTTTVTWRDESGLVVQFHLADDQLDPDERFERLIGFLDQLVPVDQAGWDAFAGRVEDRGPNDAMTTTMAMPLNTTTTVRAEASARFTLGDGRVLDANFFRPDTVCWSELGDPSVSHCSGPGTDNRVPGAPHLATSGGEGTPQFAYGHVAEDATGLRVEVGETGDPIPFRVVDERWWISDLAPAGTRLVVVHLGPDGRIVERFELVVP